MKHASGFKRFSSYMIDFSILFGVYYQMFKVAEYYVKPNDLYPPVQEMVLFTPRQFDIYFFAVTYAAVLSFLYYFFTYIFLNATLGQKLVKIQVLKQDRSRLNFTDKIKLTSVALIKFSIVFLPGPLLVLFLAIGHVFSFLLLLVALYFLTINPLLAYLNPVKLAWSDKLTRTAIFEK